jgi:hypothetical protein
MSRRYGRRHRSAIAAALIATILGLSVTVANAASGTDAGTHRRAAQAKILPPGGTLWTVHQNGFISTLRMVITPAGSVTGVLRDNLPGAFAAPIHGFYNFQTNRLIFIRELNPTNPLADQVFTGYEFRDLGTTTLDGDHLAGTFEAPTAQGGGTANTAVFGWYAIRKH